MDTEQHDEGVTIDDVLSDVAHDCRFIQKGSFLWCEVGKHQIKVSPDKMLVYENNEPKLVDITKA